MVKEENQYRIHIEDSIISFEGWLSVNDTHTDGIKHVVETSNGSRVVVSYEFLLQLLQDAYRNRNVNVDQLYTDLKDAQRDVINLNVRLKSLLEKLE